MNAQHDHHCILTFDRINWRVIGCTHRGRKITVRALTVWPPDAVVISVLDLSNADMDAYCAAALAWDMRDEAVARDRAEGARDVRH